MRWGGGGELCSALTKVLTEGQGCLASQSHTAASGSPRPRAEDRLFLEGGQACSRVLTAGEEPALCSSQASALITEARPGVQMEVPEARYSQTVCACTHTHACAHARTHARTHTHICTHARARTHTCTCARTHTHARTHARTHTHVLWTEACSLAKSSQAQVCLDFQDVLHTPGPCAPGL